MHINRLKTFNTLLTIFLVSINMKTAINAAEDPLFEQAQISGGSYQMMEDPILGRKVVTAGKDGLVLDSQVTHKEAQELRVKVRLRTDMSPTATITFKMDKTSNPETELVFSMTATEATEVIRGNFLHGGKPLHDIKAEQKKTEWNSLLSPNVNGFNYKLRAYDAIRPGWPQDFRARVEQDMAELPDHNQKWLDVRIGLENGRVRFWVDDRLMGEKTDPLIKADGYVQIALSAGAQLASYQMGKLPEQIKGFVSIPLGGYANARQFLDNVPLKLDSLPAAEGKAVLIENIPFIFSGVSPEGNDHLDIGRSLYREGDQEGYFPTTDQSFAGSLWRDPARIQLRIPNGDYDKLYLIAASDGEKDAIPEVTAMFYRPEAGYAEMMSGEVPLATAKSSSKAKPVPVILSNGRKVNLWLVEIPLDASKLTSFSDMDIIEVELTKKVYQYRAYPDPIVSGWHQGGLPSSVHIYGATFKESSIGFAWGADRFGGVWTAPGVPTYTATIKNRTNEAQSGKLTVTTRSYDETEETKQEQEVTVQPGAELKVPVSVPVRLNGYHDISATLKMNGKIWSERRSFVRLAPDLRSPRWIEGKGPLFGYWSYHGGHYTPGAEHVIDLMTQAGARTTSTGAPTPDNVTARDHWSRVLSSNSGWATVRTPWTWAKEEQPSSKEYAAYQQAFIDSVSKAWDTFPDNYRPDMMPLFAEPHISHRITDGSYPEYWGEQPFELTMEEKSKLKLYSLLGKAAAEAIRAKWPDYKILIPWGDPLFVVAFLRDGFPKNLIDGSALDIAGFSRLPEQQLHQASLHRLYILRKEYEKAGISDPLLVYGEGIFVPTEIGNRSWREQMDIYNRWALISMAYGVKRFYSGWSAFDCGSYYGAEQYGGCGIQRRIPFCDPKPAYAAYATMTDQLDQANFERWIKTGSLTTYCLDFKGPKGNVYTLWTLRGSRPVTLTFSKDGEVKVTDAMNNTKVMTTEGGKVSFNLDSSVVYVSALGTVEAVAVGEAIHADSKPDLNAILIADLGDGTWKYTSERDVIYEENNFDTFRYPGKFSASTGEDPQQGKVMVSKLEKQDKVHELMPWYNVLKPAHPITLKGAPESIGLWVQGASDWGRMVYCLRDAKGERWISVGDKDGWNCDDMHSWSSFNFDGWRYLRFELPGNVGYDNYRKYGTTWWRSEGGDAVVDLPLTLEKIIVEQRSHILYVNDIQPVASDTVRFGKLYAEYATPEDATDEAVRISKLRMPLPKDSGKLSNPIVELAKKGVEVAAPITKLEPPVSQNDGTTVHVYFKEKPEAAKYYIWCSPHEDGRNAINMTPTGAINGALVAGLRPGMKLYFWGVSQNKQGEMSKPSTAAEIVLIDQFKEK